MIFHIYALKRKETAIHWQLAANWCRVCWSSVFYGSTALVGLGLLCEVPRSHSDTPHSVGLLCASDWIIIAISTWRRTILQETDIYAPPPGPSRPQQDSKLELRSDFLCLNYFSWTVCFSSQKKHTILQSSCFGHCPLPRAIGVYCMFQEWSQLTTNKIVSPFLKI